MDLTTGAKLARLPRDADSDAEDQRQPLVREEHRGAGTHAHQRHQQDSNAEQNSNSQTECQKSSGRTIVALVSKSDAELPVDQAVQADDTQGGPRAFDATDKAQSQGAQGSSSLAATQPPAVISNLCDTSTVAAVHSESYQRSKASSSVDPVHTKVPTFSSTEPRRNLSTDSRVSLLRSRSTQRRGQHTGMMPRWLCTRQPDASKACKEQVQAQSSLPDFVPRAKLEDFDYNLPDERIAKYPVTPRDSSRLLYCGASEGLPRDPSAAQDVKLSDGSGWVMRDLRFLDAPGMIPLGSLVILNESKVIAARLPVVKATGGRGEVRTG